MYLSELPDSEGTLLHGLARIGPCKPYARPGAISLARAGISHVNSLQRF